MAYVQTRTDSDAYCAVDGKVDAFGTVVEAGAGGFGIRRMVKGIETFEVLDAMPLNRAATQLAVEAGSAAMAGKSGFTAVDFATQDYLTAAEITASNGGIKAGEAGAGDLT